MKGVGYLKYKHHKSYYTKRIMESAYTILKAFNLGGGNT